MGSSVERKTKRRAKATTKRAQGRAAKRGVELADAGQVRKAFGQVDDHVKGLVKVFQHNAQVVQVGFYKNDIWLDTFKLVLEDVVRGTVQCVIEETQVKKDGAIMTEKVNKGIDWQKYWDQAKVNVDEAMTKPTNQVPEQQLIERPDDMQPIEMEFGGDYEVSEPAEEREAADERNGGGEEHHEVRDEADSVPAVSQPG